MKVGIIGSGVVATALGEGFLKHGHEVMLGTRSPEKLADWKAKNPGAQISGLSQTAEFGDLIVLAVKGSVASQALHTAGPQNFSGKVVIDTTNPIADEPPTNGVLRFYTNFDQSQMERLQSEFADI